MIDRYRKRLQVVEATRFDDSPAGLQELSTFGLDPASVVCKDFRGRSILKVVSRRSDNKEECFVAHVGDYIIKGKRGNFFTCPAPVFADNYERVEDEHGA